MSRTTINLADLRDPATLVGAVTRALRPFQGQRLLGVVNGCGYTELVFDADTDGVFNLLSLRVEGDQLEYWAGSVDGPEGYAARCGNP